MFVYARERKKNHLLINKEEKAFYSDFVQLSWLFIEESCSKLRGNCSNCKFARALTSYRRLLMFFVNMLKGKGGLHVTFGHFYFVTSLLNKFIKVYKRIHFQKGHFTRNTLVMLNFDQNSQFLRKSQKTKTKTTTTSTTKQTNKQKQKQKTKKNKKKTRFCHFLFKMG